MSGEGSPEVELYVYYKVAQAQAQAALRVFDQAQSARAGARLLRRVLAGAEHETWMEIHRGADAPASEARLAAALLPFISGARHVEQFVPLRGVTAP